MSPVKTFGAVDFAVFVGMLLVTIIIGIYHAYKDREKKSIANYYFGGGKMSPIPLGLSIAVTFISAINIIGFPAETYLFGTAIFWFCFIIIVPTIVACLFHIPMVHRLKLVSIYQYLELRFDKKLRQACSAIMLFIMIVFIGLTIYVPGLALNAVTPLGLEWTIVLTSFVCTLYTALGGMKAVVWTDTLQTFIMLAGCLAALIKTTVHVGGFGNIWAALERGNRLNFWNFTTDPTVRNSFWSICVGTSIAASNPNQAITQRYLSCESIKKARMAAMVAIVPHFVFSVITILTGCAMYAYYEGCDPIMDKRIAKPDQMMPYLVVDVFNDVPGMAGLFVSAAFSATLSTVSSGINSLAALLLEDFVLHRYPKLSSTIQVTLSKGIVIGLGVIVMCFALTIKYFNGTIIQIAFTLGGTLGGPVLAVFTLGMFFPWANTKGTAIGQIVSTVLTGALAICGIVYGNSSAHNRAMPLSTAECTSISPSNTQSYTRNYTTLSTSHFAYEELSTVSIASDRSSLENTLFAISYIYYGTVALIIGLTVGLVASFLTGANNPKEADPKLFFPLIENKIFPASVRHFFRFGVPEISQKVCYEAVPREKDIVEQLNDAKESVV